MCLGPKPDSPNVLPGDLVRLGLTRGEMLNPPIATESVRRPTPFDLPRGEVWRPWRLALTGENSGWLNHHSRVFAEALDRRSPVVARHRIVRPDANLRRASCVDGVTFGAWSKSGASSIGIRTACSNTDAGPAVPAVPNASALYRRHSVGTRARPSNSIPLLSLAQTNNKSEPESQ